MSLFPMVMFDRMNLADANKLLVRWKHKRGPLRRPMNGTPISGGGDFAHALFHEGRPVGVVTTSSLIRENVSHHPSLTRANTVELSRICAERRDLNRVLLRLWREFVFRELPHPWAISYQDVAVHTGDLYRFDGWQMIGKSSSGPDRRSGRQGVVKRIWRWPAGPGPAALLKSIEQGRAEPTDHMA